MTEIPAGKGPAFLMNIAKKDLPFTGFIGPLPSASRKIITHNDQNTGRKRADVSLTVIYWLYSRRQIIVGETAAPFPSGIFSDYCYVFFLPECLQVCLL